MDKENGAVLDGSDELWAGARLDGDEILRCDVWRDGGQLLRSRRVCCFTGGVVEVSVCSSVSVTPLRAPLNLRWFD